MNVFLLDYSNIQIEEINIKKPKTLLELKTLLKNNLKNKTEHYEIFIIDEANQEILINNQIKYELVENILFIRQKKPNMVKQSVFTKNYDILPESKKENLEYKYNCIFCTKIIKEEKPYFCYKCQNIFHEKCLIEWNDKCKYLK